MKVYMLLLTPLSLIFSTTNLSLLQTVLFISTLGYRYAVPQIKKIPKFSTLSIQNFLSWQKFLRPIG